MRSLILPKIPYNSDLIKFSYFHDKVASFFSTKFNIKLQT